jgi:hypothetical protein
METALFKSVVYEDIKKSGMSQTIMEKIRSEPLMNCLAVYKQLYLHHLFTKMCQKSGTMQINMEKEI